ncbi:MAG: hypothetical protein FJ265_12955 [Planctomycetes bacterium]|nr:hypothetical protein [Planctomycetota bacterium]
MSRDIEKIEALLTLDRFPFAVAMFPGHVQELGDVIEAQAFDVPEDEILKVSRRLNQLLVAARTRPLAVGSAFLAAESTAIRDALPRTVHWWRPTNSRQSMPWRAARLGIASRASPDERPVCRIIVTRCSSPSAAPGSWDASALLRRLAPTSAGDDWSRQLQQVLLGGARRPHYSLGA